jgi:hypothetical protein
VRSIDPRSSILACSPQPQSCSCLQRRTYPTLDMPPQRKRKRKRVTVSTQDAPDVTGQEKQPHQSQPQPQQQQRQRRRRRPAADTHGADRVAPHHSLFGACEGPVADSRTAGQEMLSWLLHPVEPQTFFDEYWERQPLLIRRPKEPNYFTGCFGKADVERLLAAGKLTFERDLDITQYVDGHRHTFNGEGVVDAAEAWAQFRRGCSLRMLCPHAHCPKVWKLLSMLEHCFGGFVGANTYLTPAGTQGFAPHYDDIEAFVLQLEGAKEWRVYNPLSVEETLPRFSSPDLTHAELGEPVLAVTLRAGDLLYFPRGWVHEARSAPGTHSLHLTVSTSLRNTWRDLLELLLPGVRDVIGACVLGCGWLGLTWWCTMQRRSMQRRPRILTSVSRSRRICASTWVCYTVVVAAEAMAKTMATAKPRGKHLPTARMTRGGRFCAPRLRSCSRAAFRRRPCRWTPPLTRFVPLQLREFTRGRAGCPWCLRHLVLAARAFLPALVYQRAGMMRGCLPRRYSDATCARVFPLASPHRHHPLYSRGAQCQVQPRPPLHS